MFEQTLLKEYDADKKPYTLMASLLVQIGALALLVLVPLIYTQALPPARLRSVFAAPIPTATTEIKPPSTVRSTLPRTFHITPLSYLPHIAKPPSMTVSAMEAPPDPPVGSGTESANLPALIDSLPQKPPDPTKPTIAKAPQEKRLRIATMEASQLIQKVQPEYPPIAKQIHLQGTVEFTAVISKAGNIENLQLVQGAPLLVDAARRAILQWRYKPTLLNGEPVVVITNIVVNFTLNAQ